MNIAHVSVGGLGASWGVEAALFAVKLINLCWLNILQTANGAADPTSQPRHRNHWIWGKIIAQKIKLDQVSTYVSINLCWFLDLYVGCLLLWVKVFAIYYFDSFSSIVIQFAIKSNISDRVEVFPWGWYLFLHSKLFLLYQPLKNPVLVWFKI